MINLSTGRISPTIKKNQSKKRKITVKREFKPFSRPGFKVKPKKPKDRKIPVREFKPFSRPGFPVKGRNLIVRRPIKVSLSKQIGISIKNNIPITLLNKIISAKIGETITNPTKQGKKRIKVTLLLKRRANSVRKPLLR